MTLLNSFIFAVSILTLFYSGGLLVRSLTVLGRYLRLSEYVLSFILVAFATSLPELFVGVNSALQNVSLLSLGNIIGANALNISLVLGIAVIFAGGLNIEKPMEKEDYLFVLGIMVVPILMVADGIVSRFEGGILLGLFFIHIIYLVTTSHKRNIFNNVSRGEATPVNTIKHFGLFFVGVALLLGSSSFIVSYGVDLASYFALPLFLVGILISVGTTLPEVIFSFKSVSMKHGSMSLGNVFGSIVVNVALILGLVAVISPIIVENVFRTVLGLSFTLVLTVIIQAIGFFKGKLEHYLGVGLVLLALLFVIIESFFR